MAGRKKKKRKVKPGGGRRPKIGTRVWAGGRLSSPFFITGGEPYRPDMILWLELPDQLVVGYTLVDPTGPPMSFADTLRSAMDAPMIGPPRRPERIRVADRRLADEIKKAEPDIAVETGPTPELDRILQHMAESMPSGDEDELSYFEDGRVSETVVRSLFRSAETLFHVAPWKSAHDGQVIRMDIPALGVEGACLSIIGELGESLGVIIFPSFLDFERFLEKTGGRDMSSGPVDLGCSLLSINFERGADLPASMLREAMAKDWPVAGPDAYPWVQSRDRDGMLCPLSERDVRVASACASALTAFFTKHRGLFAGESVEPVRESWLDQDDLEVRLTAPYQAQRLFTESDPKPLAGPVRTTVRERAKVGRNHPCPCGSGKKYKKCCLGKERAADAADCAPATVHDMDRRLTARLQLFADQRFGDAWLRAGDLVGDDEADQLTGHLLAHHFAVEGKPVSRWFVEERRQSLSPAELEWLEAQQAAWLSILEVQAVEPGRSVTFRDLLTGLEWTVIEVDGSKTLVRRDAILGRIVDHRGESVLCGCHHRPLPPMDAAEVLRRARGRLRRKREVPADRLRDEKICRYLVDRWEEAVDQLDFRLSVPPRMQNTDGDEVLITVDHFDFDPADRGELELKLAGMEGVQPPEPGEDHRRYVFTRPGNPMHKGWQNTIVGHAELDDGRLRLETNSLRRADALRIRVETACRKKIRRRDREHSDPLDSWTERRRPDRSVPPGDETPPPEAIEMILKFKEQHYAEWVDQPLPALDGKTPRETARTRAGRERVDVLLKDMENTEARAPAEQGFDFSGLRRSLRIER